MNHNINWHQIVNTLTNRRQAAFDERVHNNIRDFWGRIPETHPFATHPILGRYGPDLSQKGYAYTKGRANRYFTPEDPYTWKKEVGVLGRIMQLERSHEAELEALAVKAVSQIYGMSPDQVKPHLGETTVRPYLQHDSMEHQNPPPQTPEDPADAPEGDPEMESLPTSPSPQRNLKPFINKRLTMHALSQGAAQQGMMGMHHIVRDGIERISPELLRLYDQFSAGNAMTNWMVDYTGMTRGDVDAAQGGIPPEFHGYANAPAQHQPDQVAMSAAEEGVDWVEQPDGSVQPVIHAAAIGFPLLIQELVKGAMDVLTMNSLAQHNPEELHQIYKATENAGDEFYHMQAGGELWRRLTAALPDGVNLATAVAALDDLPPNELHQIMMLVAQSSPRAKQALQDLVGEEDNL